jgi:hypothetical protein
MIIAGKYKIEPTRYDIIVYVKVDSKKENESWKAVGYFGCVRSVLNFLVDDELLRTGLTDLQTIVDKQQELYDLIGKLTEDEISGMGLKR